MALGRLCAAPPLLAPVLTGADAPMPRFDSKGFGFISRWISRRPHLRLTPGQVAVLAGVVVILTGTVVLMLPWSTPADRPLRLLDALFMAVSATCVTGLLVIDPATELTTFGQLVIVVLIQIGGFGSALIATLFFLAAGRRIGLWHRMLLAESLSTLNLAGLVKSAKLMAAGTLLVEACGGMILAWRFAAHTDASALHALYQGIFHAVSAMNNAGFSLFSTNLSNYRGDPVVLLTIAGLIVVGGLGFPALQDIVQTCRGQKMRLEVHSKLVVLMTGALIGGGTVAILWLEGENPRTLGALPLEERLVNAGFQAISARTAGFNTISIADCHLATLFLMVLFMFVGGSPGGTAGGIKTTTLAIMGLTVMSLLRRQADVCCFHRRVAQHVVILAFTLGFLSLILLVTLTLVLTFTDEEHHFLDLLFEVASALGTVGFSMGNGGTLSLSAVLSDAGKGVIIVAMLLGRFGPLVLGLLAIRTPAHPLYRLPLARVAIG